MHLSVAFPALLAASSIAFPTSAETDISSIEQGLATSQAENSTSSFLSSILSSGNCDVSGCVTELEPIVSSCEDVVSDEAEDTSEDLACFETVLKAASNNSTESCNTCAQNAVQRIQQELSQASSNSTK